MQTGSRNFYAIHYMAVKKTPSTWFIVHDIYNESDDLLK